MIRIPFEAKHVQSILRVTGDAPVRILRNSTYKRLLLVMSEFSEFKSYEEIYTAYKEYYGGTHSNVSRRIRELVGMGVLERNEDNGMAEFRINPFISPEYIAQINEGVQ